MAENKTERVKMFIPRDPLNPVKSVWVCINGQDYYLAVGKEIEVDKHVKEAWDYSYQETMKAYEKINPDTEIQS